MTGPFQLPQRLQAAANLKLTSGVLKAKLPTDTLCQIGAMADVGGIRHLPEIRDVCGRRQCPLDLILYQHAAQHASSIEACSVMICGQKAVLAASRITGCGVQR